MPNARASTRSASYSSCILSASVQREVLISGFQFRNSLVFPAPNLGDGGGCFAPMYNEATADHSDFGPCTATGRDALYGMPDVDKCCRRPLGLPPDSLPTLSRLGDAARLTLGGGPVLYT